MRYWTRKWPPQGPAPLLQAWGPATTAAPAKSRSPGGRASRSRRGRLGWPSRATESCRSPFPKPLRARGGRWCGQTPPCNVRQFTDPRAGTGYWRGAARSDLPAVAPPDQAPRASSADEAW